MVKHWNQLQGIITWKTEVNIFLIGLCVLFGFKLSIQENIDIIEIHYNIRGSSCPNEYREIHLINDSVRIIYTKYFSNKVSFDKDGKRYVYPDTFFSKNDTFKVIGDKWYRLFYNEYYLFFSTDMFEQKDTLKWYYYVNSTTFNFYTELYPDKIHEVYENLKYGSYLGYIPLEKQDSLYIFEVADFLRNNEGLDDNYKSYHHEKFHPFYGTLGKSTHWGCTLEVKEVIFK